MGTPTFSGFGFKMNVQLERHLEMSEPHILFLRKNDVRIEEIPYAELTLYYKIIE
ncbi:Uncharacterized protein XB16_1439 [Leptospira santarosai]|uniref:Uncharacterized protein n=1 Tax=Leptospira santarosai TaxID=28183 RepID=A0A2P1QSA1_9LEPT|nr:Uncharacterized protein XB16_1439 [Leptospira santarosai]